jgi:hypothetical protein
MLAAYRNAIATHGASIATHIGLVDDTGTELTGGSPAYARKAVTWTTASDGTIAVSANLTFDIPASTNVSGWRAFSALTSGTDYGGASLTQETYAAQGQYVLLATLTKINHATP